MTKDEIKRHSPSGKVPALVDKSIGVTVCESLAIIYHIAEKFPDAGLIPTDPAARAMCLSTCAEMHAGFQALREHLPCNFVATGVRHGAEALRIKEVRDDIHRLGHMWSDLKIRFGFRGPYLFGKFSAADCMYAPVAARFMCYDPKLSSLAAFPLAQEYVRALWSMEYMQEWIEEAKKVEPSSYVHNYEVYTDAYEGDDKK